MNQDQLKKQNSILQQTVAYLEAQISQSRHGEGALVTKVQQMNSTREAIVGKMNDMASQYQDHIRQLQGKVDRLTRHNEALSKQVVTYKQEAIIFENRILEKERLLTSLVLQQYTPDRYAVEASPAPPVSQQRFETPAHSTVSYNERLPVEYGNPLPSPKPSEKSIPRGNTYTKAQTPKQESYTKKDVQQPQPLLPPRRHQKGVRVQRQVEPLKPLDQHQKPDTGPSRNIHESENFFSQMASNSFVSEIVPREDNHPVPDTPFSDKFYQNNEEAGMSDSQNFFESLGQSTSLNEYNHPNQQRQDKPTQHRMQVSEMMAPPKLQPKKPRRNLDKVVNASTFD